ncbi:zinc finger protein 184-like isoform X2 [Engraulis encrasicolus]|uniref:zinc finger protein 184-like isoform X2 n=1 Tax=Engraulis encrasicolus TaxID=184585 RepID=UPI002FD3C586
MGSTDGETLFSMAVAIKTESDTRFYFSDQKPHPTWTGCSLGSAANDFELLDIKTEVKSELIIDEVPSELSGWFMDPMNDHDIAEEDASAVSIDGSHVKRDPEATVNAFPEGNLQETQGAQLDTEVLILTEPKSSYQNGRVCHALTYKSTTKPTEGEASEPETSPESSSESPSSSGKRKKTGRGRNKTYPCPTCGRVFSVRFNMLKHAALHTGEKSHVCHLCGKDFARPDYLNSHLKVHSDEHGPPSGMRPTKERPMAFACSHCEKTFNRACFLRDHMRQHTQERPFACHLCDRRFLLAVHLKRHLDSHVDKRPFVCSLCGHGFNRKSTLEKHTRIHTGQRQYKCSQCGKDFPYKYSLTCHMKTHVD